MAMPEALRKARMHVFAAEREIDKVYGDDPSGSIAIYEARAEIKRCRGWIDEYTDALNVEDAVPEPSEDDLADISGLPG